MRARRKREKARARKRDCERVNERKNGRKTIYARVVDIGRNKKIVVYFFMVARGCRDQGKFVRIKRLEVAGHNYVGLYIYTLAEEIKSKF